MANSKNKLVFKLMFQRRFDFELTSNPCTLPKQQKKQLDQKPPSSYLPVRKIGVLLASKSIILLICCLRSHLTRYQFFVEFRLTFAKGNSTTKLASESNSHLYMKVC